MIKEQRQERILSELAKRGSVGVVELSKLLGVSEATVRRDLGELAGHGLLRRTHGGAALVERGEELPYHAKAAAYLPEKRRIGAAAAALLEPGQVIGCTGGTTVAQAARLLQGKRLVVVTNALNIALELAGSEETDVIMTGGALRSRSLETVGHIAERSFREFCIDVALLGADGISIKEGITTYHLAEAHANRVLVERSREVWVLADHSKLGKVTPAVIGPVSRMTRLITDAGAPDDFVASLREQGIDVVVV
ncbi:MAG: DeoR/GlpR transcriptional regulator [Firmicutes bacterium]|nr:DeoR/GlpR transcriptional regulator [Bacillota bacterium]